MSNLDLAAIRERARLCAYQEWEDAGYNYRFQEGEVVANSASVSVAIVDNPYDLEHIAGMDPATTTALLDEIDRLNATIQRVRDVCTTGVNHAGTQLGWNIFRDAILRALEGGEQND